MTSPTESRWMSLLRAMAVAWPASFALAWPASSTLWLHTPGPIPPVDDDDDDEDDAPGRGGGSIDPDDDEGYDDEDEDDDEDTLWTGARRRPGAHASAAEKRDPAPDG